jgi:hypothetical protein
MPGTGYCSGCCSWDAGGMRGTPTACLCPKAGGQCFARQQQRAHATDLTSLLVGAYALANRFRQPTQTSFQSNLMKGCYKQAVCNMQGASKVPRSEVSNSAHGISKHIKVVFMVRLAECASATTQYTGTDDIFGPSTLTSI